MTLTEKSENFQLCSASEIGPMAALDGSRSLERDMDVASYTLKRAPQPGAATMTGINTLKQQNPATSTRKRTAERGAKQFGASEILEKRKRRIVELSTLQGRPATLTFPTTAAAGSPAASLDSLAPSSSARASAQSPSPSLASLLDDFPSEPAAARPLETPPSVPGAFEFSSQLRLCLAPLRPITQASRFAVYGG